MYLVLQQEHADDYVIGTGELHSVRELRERVFALVGLNYLDYVVTDEKFLHPEHNVPLVGDASKARKILGWTPSIYFEQLIELMVEEDLRYTRGQVKY